MNGIRVLMGCLKLAGVMDQCNTSSFSYACADVSHWSGKLHQTYSCNPALWLIWSVISPVFHFNRRDYSAVAGLSDLIKINFRVKDLAEFSSQILASSMKDLSTSPSISSEKRTGFNSAINPLILKQISYTPKVLSHSQNI